MKTIGPLVTRTRTGWLAGLFVLAMAIMVAGQPALAAETEESVARVTFLRGDATVTSGATGTARQLKRGDRLVAGDLVETGDKSVVQLVFPDKQMLYIKAGSSVRIESFRFSGGAADDTSVTELLKGGMRSVSGLVGRSTPANVRYKAGETTIGIRGTAIDIDHEPGDSTVVAFDYGNGYVEVVRPGLCIRTELARGNRVIVDRSKVRHKALKRASDDPSRTAPQLVHAGYAERMALAADLGQALPLEDALFTLAMMRELPQFYDQALLDTVAGLSSGVADQDVVPLMMTATMLYPSEAPQLLRAAAQSDTDLVYAVQGVMCGMADQSAEGMAGVVREALDLGVTREQAQKVLSNLEQRGCT